MQTVPAQPQCFIVDRAITALDEFGGDLAREEAQMLLRLWTHCGELTEEQATEVLANYPTALEIAKRLVAQREQEASRG